MKFDLGGEVQVELEEFKLRRKLGDEDLNRPGRQYLNREPEDFWGKRAGIHARCMRHEGDAQLTSVNVCVCAVVCVCFI